MRKKIGNSKLPLYHQLPIMAKNLEKATGHSVYIEIGIWKHTRIKDPDPRFKISLIPESFDPVIQYEVFTWPELLSIYHSLVKGETPND